MNQGDVNSGFEYLMLGTKKGNMFKQKMYLFHKINVWFISSPLHPWKLTWNQNITKLKRKSIFHPESTFTWVYTPKTNWNRDLQLKILPISGYLALKRWFSLLFFSVSGHLKISSSEVKLPEASMICEASHSAVVCACIIYIYGPFSSPIYPSNKDKHITT